MGITGTSKVQKVLIGASGRQNMRAVIVDGREIHRCPAIGPAAHTATRSV